MAVTEWHLHSGGARGGAQGSDLASVKHSYGLRYRVKTDDATPSPFTVLEYFRLNPSLPWIGNAFKLGVTLDFRVICKAVDADYIEHSQGWFEVSAGFEPIDTQQNQQEQPGTDGKTTTDPIKWLHDIDVSYTQISVPVESAVFRGFRNGRGGHRVMRPGKVHAMTNSALVPYDPQVEEELDIKIIRISLNTLAYDGALFDFYQGATNSDNVVIDKPAYRFRETFKPYQGKIKVLGATFASTNGISYFRQLLEIHVHPDGWRREILDRGIHRKAAVGDKRADGTEITDNDLPPEGPFVTAMLDEDDMPLMTPVLLDGLGAPLKADRDAVYGIWSTKEEVPFMGLAGKAW